MSAKVQKVLPRDIQAFLANYPAVPISGHGGQPSVNYLFYLNRLRCQPSDLTIDEVHERWLGDYRELESNHGYIQWLFPIQEDGMNYEAQRLLPHEIQPMKSSEEVTGRLVKSYEMMLDFYGMRLQSSETGLVGRSLPPRNYSSRYKNLLRAPHNNLRISRILKCLSELGLERFNAGFLLHVLNEQSENNELNSPLLRDSMDRWWANCIRDDYERDWVNRAVAKVRTGGEFTRQMYENALTSRQTRGGFSDDGTAGDAGSST
ncbi:hypothetical protein HYDPIDRAFT_175558 [Hydnomerulius pinastri MD-312]|uniref:Opioid growth factor receptor (OGFr) conserved domain-containing protein n=1 Tax=Hydnomerulius pinastri MD-312 TaxID=994086 RepID=A0A0C9WG14_9AGAM|nr:hypothetical protein HYDPIDRAFT_175558 [Hydnomerulius pinastri MD-312]